MSVTARLAVPGCLAMLALLGACAQTPQKSKGSGVEIAPVYRVSHAAGLVERLEAARARASSGRSAVATRTPGAAGPASVVAASARAEAAAAPRAVQVHAPGVSRGGGWALVPVSPNVYELHADDERAGRSRGP